MSDVHAMRSRGFDQLVIDEQRNLARRGDGLNALIAGIEDAFSSITLGSGIGLTEADALDDCADDRTIAACRENDERMNWSQIPAEDLNRYHTALAFFDAEGMRFHLPAFLIASIKGEFKFDLYVWLTQSTTMDKQYSLLSKAQRQAVRAYLIFAQQQVDYEADRDHINLALEHFWSD